MKRLALFLVVGVLAAGAAGVFVYRRVTTPYRGYAAAEQFVDLPSGASTRAIGDLLVASGVISDPLTYRLALWRSGQARLLKAGDYRFDQPMTPLDVIAKISRGEVHVVRVTFPEGLTVKEMAAIFETQGLGLAAEFVNAANDGSLVQNLDAAARTLEGYLFPETYALSRHTDARKLVSLMVEQFKRILTPELRAAAASRGLSVREMVTLASIVEKETARHEERPLVAAVYQNRLRIGMPLQCDPTVIYALVGLRKYTGNLRREDLALDSPYNTYRFPGLPPGPIAAPGKASLESVAAPAPVPFLYFVSRNDGSHEFARSLDDHNRNVQKYQVQYFRDRRLEGSGGPGESGRSSGSGKSGKAEQGRTKKRPAPRATRR